MAPYAYRPFAEADRDELARILGLAFVQSTADSRGWIEKNDTAHARVVTAGGRVVGGLFLLPMGQWFGARSVPMTGIAAVGVDPPARSEGAATFLMRETVGELAAQGVALSALYASTQPLYRRAGYEQAGQLYRCKMATARIFSNDRALRVRALGDADEKEVLRLHREHGRTNPGTLERSARMWERVRDGRREEDEVHGFGIEGEQGLEGYLYYRSAVEGTGHPVLHLEDVVVSTPGAARRVLAFFREHRTLVERVIWNGHPAHPLFLAAREQRHTITHHDTWMLRVVDAAKALELRGYTPGVEAEIHLEIEDDLLRANAGPLVLRVRDGRGRVERGGRGSVRIDVRTLAPLYTGFVSPEQARVGFGLDAGPADAAALARIFAGPEPWMQDGF